MRLAVGPRLFDVTTRALVVGVLGDVAGDELLRRAERCCSEGADIVELQANHDLDIASSVGLLIRLFDVSVCLGTASPSALAAATSAGAAMARPGPGDPGAPFLTVAAQSGTTVVISGPDGTEPATSGVASDDDDDEELGPCAHLVALARRCEEAGVPPSHVVLDSGTSRRARARIVTLGYPVMASAVSSSPDAGTDPIVVADLALAVITGCRLVRAVDVRQARRVVDVVTAILEAR